MDQEQAVGGKRSRIKHPIWAVCLIIPLVGVVVLAVPAVPARGRRAGLGA